MTGGRNGYGAKLCNIFSTEFTVETADGKHKYKQTWTDNMSKCSKARITDNKKGEQYTKVTFKPDMAKFGMTEMDTDLEAVIKRRVYDLAGCVGNVKVFLNGERIKIKNFKQYVELYTKAVRQVNGDSEDSSDAGNAPIVYEKVNDRWEIAFAVSDGQFNQVSFVNSIATTRGGTHVNYIADQITNKLLEATKKKNKAGAQLKQHQIRNHMWIFVNCLIENPAFDSQTKETLTLRQSAFGSKCPVGEDFIKKVLRSGVMENILKFATYQADLAMKKTDAKTRARITGLPKLEDANLAGTKNGHRCTLILTEGDSAKTLAVAGLGVVGRDHYGVFPLRGKLLNVRDASHQQIMNNAEIQAIKKIMGLRHGETYTSTEGLRYGHLMIMTDQDQDGSHIKGLIINYFEKFYESLLRLPGFLIEFITPIVRVTRGTQSIDFFTMPEYEYWKEGNNEGRGWKAKYYKGLGTSDSRDAKKYFSDLDRHLKEFHAMQDEERKLIDMAFSKSKADDRKEWLRTFRPGTYMDHTVDKIMINDFINKELILFSMADNIRSIPSMIDGLKPGQRKVIYACFKRKLKGEIKVAQLGGYVAEHTSYHHGEQSLYQTIIGLAQQYVGANNVNLLEPNGQFGSRLQGGKDAASPRYIHTELGRITRKLFRQEDDPILTPLFEDGQQIEPQNYVPILPVVLVNGSEGIGTGWSSFIPNYNPEDIIDNIKRLMNGEEMQEMVPWYRGFSGQIEMTSPGKFSSHGVIRQIDDTTVEITELPIRYWTQDMKEWLEAGISGTEKTAAFIKDYSEYHTDTTVHFIVKLTEKGMAEALAEGLENKFKLVRQQSIQNMVAFDSEGRIRKYNSISEIIQEFYDVRLVMYQKRKESILAEYSRELERISNQARFIMMIIEGSLIVSKKKRTVLIEELRELKFAALPPMSRSSSNSTEIVEDDANADEDQDSAGTSKDYDYLLNMPIHSLTIEKVERLMNDKSKKEYDIDQLIKITPKELWSRDLDEFMVEWKAALEHDEKMKENGPVIKKTKKAGASRGKKRTNDEADGDYAASPRKKASAAPRKLTQPKLAQIAPPEIPFGGGSQSNKPLKTLAESKTSQFVDPTAASPIAVKQSSESSVSPPNREAVEPAKKSATVSRARPPTKTLMDDSDDDDYAAKIIQARAAKKTSTADSASEKVLEKEPPAPSKPEPKSKPSAAPKRPATAKAKSRAIVSDGSDDEDSADDLDAISAAAPATRAPSSRARRPVAKSKTYYLSSDEEDKQTESDEDFENDD